MAIVSVWCVMWSDFNNKDNMKKIQNKFRVKINAMIAAVLGMLGVTSCIAPVMYGPGIPEDLVQVLGEVKNEQGEALPSMQVIINTSTVTLNHIIYTNDEGKFGADYGFPQKSNDTLHVIVNDTANVYASDTVHMAFSDMRIDRETEWEKVHFAEMEIQLKKK